MKMKSNAEILMSLIIKAFLLLGMVAMISVYIAGRRSCTPLNTPLRLPSGYVIESNTVTHLFRYRTETGVTGPSEVRDFNDCIERANNFCIITNESDDSKWVRVAE